MSGKNLISICCLSYNHEKFIKQCISSIWQQKYSNIEILALDDGSTDNSLQVLKELKANSPFPMTVIGQKNSGNIGANLNKLIKSANGEFITFIACDDAYIENELSKRINIMQNNNKLALVCNSKVNYIDENNNTIQGDALKIERCTNPTIEEVLELDYTELGSFYIQGSIFRKDIIDIIGGFDEDMICDDIILRTKYLRYLLNHTNYDIKLLHEPCVFYRRHSGNISQNALRQVKSTIQYCARYWKDRTPPQCLFEWIEIALKNNNLSNDEKIELFLNSSYILKILQQKNYLKLINKEGFQYFSFGIPFLFTFCKYKNGNKKIKIIKLFNIQIAKWEK